MLPLVPAWALFQANEHVRAGPGLRVYGNYGSGENPNFLFGFLSEAFLMGEYSLRAFEKVDAIFGGRAGLAVLFPGQQFGEEIARLQRDGVGVWSLPRLGWLAGFDLGARRKMIGQLSLRADVIGQYEQLFLFADAGYSDYSTTIETQQATVDKKPDLVQRFVDASIIGWYNYLYGDNKAANDLIKKDNPDMTDGQIAYSIKAMKDSGLITSGDAATKGIGCMTDARYKDFFDLMVKINVEPADLDYKKGYTTQFVCKGVGMDLMKKS